jgi:hypothetical protein
MDNKSLNFRIFRRNKKNLIIIWNLKNLTTDQKNEMHFELIPSDENDDTKSIEFVPFIPIDKTKFVDDVAGGVIGHEENSLDPNGTYNIKITLGRNNIITKNILILPVKKQQKQDKAISLMAYDDANKKFEKLSGTWIDNKFVLLTKNI